MASSARFNLKQPKSKSETLIYMMFSYDGNRLKYSTGQKVKPKDWNDNKQMMRSVAAGAGAINDYLTNLSAKANAIYLDCLKNGKTPSTDYFREQLNQQLDKTDIGGKLNFFTAFDEFVKIQTAQKAPNTIKKYRSIRSLLKEFEQSDRRKITFESIDSAFYERLLDYFYQEKEYLNNTAGKYISGIKTFLGWATDRGYNDNLAFRRFKTIQEEADIIYLTQTELDTLFQMNLSNNSRLEKVRDLFCLACATGLRHSDVIRLKPDNFKKYIKIKAQKTRRDVTIPYNYISQTIYEKYKAEPRFLPRVSNQKCNDYLKELCQLAGIDEQVTLTQYRRAKPIQVTKPKYELVSFHDARRTFIVISLENGMRAEVVMEISGHKSYQSFKKYIKIVPSVAQQEMEKGWNPSNVLKAI